VLHDAALNPLAEHGVAVNRIREGLLRTDIRSGIQKFSLSYNYDRNDAEEERKAQAITNEWLRVLHETIGDSERLRVPAYRFAPSTARELMPKVRRILSTVEETEADARPQPHHEPRQANGPRTLLIA
jgi:hypothetical protein